MVNKCIKTLAILAVITFGLGNVTRGKTDREIRDTVVMISSKHGLCSGTQIQAPSGKKFILSAGHCDGIVDDKGNVEVTAENGEHYVRAAVEEDDNSDLLLIEGIDSLPALAVGQNDHRFERIRTFTHGSGLPTYETSGVIIADQEITIPLFSVVTAEDAEKCQASRKYTIVEGMFGNDCAIKTTMTVTTAMTVPGSSGGCLLSPDGQLIGVVTGGDDHFSVFVTLKDIKDFLRNR